MQLEAIARTSAPLTQRIAPHWRMPLLRLALCWAGLLMFFAPDWAEMVMQWWNSSTYNHILFVPLILGWLVAQRAPQLAQLTPSAWWPGLIGLAGALVIWLLGNISGLATASHLGIVLMLQTSAIALLGPRIAAALLFPLAYGLFLVPIGDELVPALQMVTAFLTIWLTEASGIPAIIDGVFIDTPVGLFEVAEACSGVKFLVAMVALGTLVAHVCYRNWWRRAAFMALAIALPILANGVRAWGTIYIAQSQGIAFAAGFDHIFYGWIFFALVTAALIGMGWRFFDRAIDDPFIDVAALQSSRLLDWLEGFADQGARRGWTVAGIAAAMVLAVLGWAAAARSVEAPLPAQISLPQVPGWQLAARNEAYPWEPRMGGADHRLIGYYQDAAGRQVTVAYALYAAQDDGREAGAFGEGALPPDTEWRWLSPATATNGAMGDRLLALGVHQRLAFTWYRHGDWTGRSNLRLKLANMRDRALLTAQPTSELILSAEDSETHSAEQAIGDFLAATGPVGPWMDRIGGLD